MKKIFPSIGLFCLLSAQVLHAQVVTIQINATSGKIPISPSIFGKNNSLSDDASNPLSANEWQFLRDAGVKLFRENGGNNATKYNWRLKLSSHPDWYNNVYKHDWDFAAKSLTENIPVAHGMWAFQLIGKSASNTSNNFNDWAYNQSKWWSGTGQNLAGGGTVNATGGSKATKDGNPDLYLENWPADSTIGILDKWFGDGGLGLNKTTINYWNMDNEPEIWSGTHDDLMPAQLSAEAFIQQYISVAKKARAKFPDIKLAGPVPANEWQWYNYNNNAISYNGTNYVWLEYFIKRIAEEQKSSGIRLLDVLDIHFYPGATSATDIVQLHRVFFDKNYVFPEANGVKRIGGGWDNNITQEYIFGRCREWLVKYMGADHGVTFSVSETGINGSDPNVTAVWYASTLGTFADEGVEAFTPWSWKTGMWETLHLFSRYSLPNRIQSVSSSEELVSAYSSISNDEDSVTVFLVNRSQGTSKQVNVSFAGFTPGKGGYTALTLKNLPSNETFQSHTINALKKSITLVNNGTFSMELAPMSVTAVLLSSASNTLPVKDISDTPVPAFEVHADTRSQQLKVSYSILQSSDIQFKIYDMQGKLLLMTEKTHYPTGSYSTDLNTSGFESGVYIIQLLSGNSTLQKKWMLVH